MPSYMLTSQIFFGFSDISPEMRMIFDLPACGVITRSVDFHRIVVGVFFLDRLIEHRGNHVVYRITHVLVCTRCSDSPKSRDRLKSVRRILSLAFSDSNL